MYRRNVVLRLNSSGNSFMRRVLVQKNFVKITTGVGKLNTTERNHGHLRLRCHSQLSSWAAHGCSFWDCRWKRNCPEQFPQLVPLGQSLRQLSCYCESTHSPSARGWCQDHSTNFTQDYDDVLPSDLHELYASEAVLRKLSTLKIVELLSDRRDGSEVKMDRV